MIALAPDERLRTKKVLGQNREGKLLMKIRGIRILGVVILAAILSGCFSFRGGDETVIQPRSSTTDRELQDLKAAYDKGIISEREYNQERERLSR
jgi:uncharacterized membrane protein